MWRSNCSVKVQNEAYFFRAVKWSLFSRFLQVWFLRANLSFVGEERKTFPRECKNSLPPQSDKRLSLRDFYFGLFSLWSVAWWSEVLYIFYIHAAMDGEVPPDSFSLLKLLLPIPPFNSVLYLILPNEERCTITYVDNYYLNSTLFCLW